MRSDASTVAEYLAQLPPDRREAITAVRKVVLENLPRGYEEAINWGMITYQVPLATYDSTYNGQPLMVAALASQKNHMAVYLTGIYTDDKARSTFEQKYRATGKRFDVGKSCVRFRKLDDLPLPLIGQTIRSLPMKKLIELFERVGSARKATKKKTAKKKTAKKKTAKKKRA
jgi:uncharacterized protein YdhG (YjbR/CyaY superfamily)